MTHTRSASSTALVIHSPHAGREKRFAQALAALCQSHLTLAEVLSIKDVDLSAGQGQQWRSRGIDLVIAAGGDGLIGGILAPVVESGLPLGILPLGTANDLDVSELRPQESVGLFRSCWSTICPCLKPSQPEH